MSLNSNGHLVLVIEASKRDDDTVLSSKNFNHRTERRGLWYCATTAHDIRPHHDKPLQYKLYILLSQHFMGDPMAKIGVFITLTLQPSTSLGIPTHSCLRPLWKRGVRKFSPGNSAMPTTKQLNDGWYEPVELFVDITGRKRLSQSWETNTILYGRFVCGLLIQEKWAYEILPNQMASRHQLISAPQISSSTLWLGVRSSSHGDEPCVFTTIQGVARGVVGTFNPQKTWK
ncbi:hypothetical protein JAAARDRAFT_701340 [Jaapia argillacea MUCL 33604]|uniref:Uncharacterized protein n=1 Tax=Jaapia argillacea MUCL 33604 TaxID=933084 RepID=A0A067Q8R5_9AGAM|nr:hypothetical protein JAAARDRAFT_701340 [Jaapia argillacea MUCL 33604]